MIALMVKKLFSSFPPIFICSQFIHFFSFPIVFTLCGIYLSMCTQSNYRLFQPKLNKLDLSERTVTDGYKCTSSHSTHTCSEPEESLILRSPACARKALSQLIQLLRSRKLCSVPALLQCSHVVQERVQDCTQTTRTSGQHSFMGSFSRLSSYL